MPRRRGAGEGSIYFDEKRHLWVGRLPRDDQGRRQAVYGRTRRDVQSKVADQLHAASQGLPAIDNRTRLGDYLGWWLREVVAYEVRPRTAQSYEQHVRVHIVPALGRVPLAKLDPKRVREFLNALLRRGLAPSSVTRIRAVLLRALNDAMREGYVARNVVTLVKAPRGQHREPVVFTADELAAVLKTARGSLIAGPVLLAARTGMRMGEVLGLGWCDVDLEAGSLRVRQALQPVPGEGLRLAEPKSATSRRVLPLSASLVDLLVAERMNQEERKAALGDAWTDTGLVFTTSVGTPMSARNLTRSWYKLLMRAGVERRGFHTLRRTYATLLASRGVHPKAAQRLLGHSSPSLTLSAYTAVSAEMLREASEAIDADFGSQ